MSLNHHENWEQKFALLQDFYAEYGRFPLQKESYKGVRLGNWCVNQRRTATIGKLLPERYQRLAQIGFWKSNTKELRWEHYYQLMLQFYKEYGCFPKVDVVYHDANIGKWCANQKLLIKTGKCPANRLEKLMRAGLVDSTRDANWAHKFAILQNYYAEFNRFPKRSEVYADIQLGTWCAEQKRRSKLPGYPAERLQMLEAIGLVTNE